MDKIVKLALVAYILIMLGCTVAFFMQKSVIYNDHINPAREKMLASMGTNPDTAQSIEYNRALAETSIRAGNEIQEHLYILLLANLTTGIFLVVCVIYLKNDNKGVEHTR